MLTFMDALPGHRLPALVSRWDALDIAADAETLREKGYTDYVVCDLEKDEPIRLGHRYDAIIFLHLLEHLHIPERCLQSFLPLLTANGILTGGSPTMPKLIADMGYEKRLASAARPLGHVSILSPERIEQFAQVHGLKLSFLSGSHFTRSTGSWIENSALWLRLNMAFGWLFPSLGNEIYFSLSRQ
jgi:2-polyprenyl-3-methyl-5-hydroxy-6-metoxy-1,4-benzoquinol methylase